MVANESCLVKLFTTVTDLLMTLNLIKIVLCFISDYWLPLNNQDKATLDYWYTDHANAINGTFGSMFSPFINKNESLNIFSPDLCRSLMLEFKGVEVITMGVFLVKMKKRVCCCEGHLQREHIFNRAICGQRYPLPCFVRL